MLVIRRQSRRCLAWGAAMRDDLLNMPADAPASEAWAALWALGIDIPYPTPGQTAGDLLASLEPRLLKKIHHTAQEATPHE